MFIHAVLAERVLSIKETSCTPCTSICSKIKFICKPCKPWSDDEFCRSEQEIH